MRGQVAAGTQNQALAALLFLYREVLTVDLPWMDNVVRPQTRNLVLVVHGFILQVLLAQAAL